MTESTERLTLYTTAPRAYDGFSAVEVCPNAGTDHHGTAFRIVSLERRDLEWQTSRYASGMYAWATEADAKRFPALWQLNETDRPQGATR